MGGDARQHFKDMIKVIGGIMSNSEKRFFIIPVCTRKSAIDIRLLPTEYSQVVITLPPLNYDSAIKLFRDIYGDSDLSIRVQKQHHFHIAMNDIGYIPSFWDSQDDVHVLISLGLIRMHVTRGFKLPSGRTLGELERNGLVYLATAEDPKQDMVVVTMPFVSDYLRSTEQQKSAERSLVEMSLLSKKPGNYLRGAKGSSSLLARQVRLKSLKVCQEKIKSLVRKDRVLPLTPSTMENPAV
ncbi:hypothetical protein BGZ65_008845 [Modicella reniformis]|uniref:Uncharacterized protein n=1 Tax=Modicella reniformis TaxID=1440133 RepID=A0A9P6MAW0_9FUNG|nr:hypothetical protein BGZ65_008845 [Modicella reniformis]